ncbi:NarK family nitrate/nitrite MFS transporter [Nocardioides iriomotensis]|uniref:Nitrate/nitrite transporter n=1 Tax=Nocardioides iriomotensis TaxID=715784 RepID=A0A4Q5IU12_9ACTN|nr:NarK family nitrate/nitrite MFS transporter [Nocardioides iriomotensis]RYU09334.1 NarK family nitrate/nitrite MFS transporter [Nocardioides iriomotensis]
MSSGVTQRAQLQTQPRGDRKGWIDVWDPENPEFWQTTGRRVARRNLTFSILAEHLGFSVWVLWSIVAVNLNTVGFAFTEGQLFWLVALPNLVGATLRLPYTFAVPRFGGRNWTIVSALLLLIPTTSLAWAVSNPDTSFGTMLFVAALAGFGGGNFASSMTNISWFYPEKEKGWALGLNAAGGNIGVAVVQAPFVVSAVITIGAGIHLERAGLMWIPLILLAAFCAWRWMDNLTVAKTDFASSAAAARKRHTWVMSFLYIGTFGSFIGYAAAFPLLIKGQFPDVNVTAYAFLGALVGSLIRPLGGRLSDKVGGARVTAAAFVLMGTGVLGVVWSLSLQSFGLFFASFMALFVATGVGNGSTYRMIPAIFRHGVDPADHVATAAAKRQAAAAIGIISAIGAYGGFLVPRTYGWSTTAFGSIVPALYVYVGLYVVMLAVTWFFYLRRSAPLASAGV